MKLLIDLFGETETLKALQALESEVKDMHVDYYIRNVIRTLS